MRDDDLLTVSELAAMSGVTVRTLHHYDEIGLLVPSHRSPAGYRQYSRSDAERLARIAAYRACGMSLPDIGAVLASTGTPLVDHLNRQLALLDERAAILARQRDILRKALEAHAMGINLEPEEILEVFGDHDPRAYAEEAQERWGETDAYRESHRRTSAYTKADWQRMGEQSESIEAEFAACLAAGLPPDSERAKSAAEAHRQHIDAWFYPCTYDMQTALADMYVQDPRFAEHYDARASGLATYVRDAIWANAVGRIA